MHLSDLSDRCIVKGEGEEVLADIISQQEQQAFLQEDNAKRIEESAERQFLEYELPPLSLSALCRTYLEDICIVLGSSLEVLVRSPNPRFDSDMADLVSPLNDDRDDNYLTRSLLTRSNLLLQSVQCLCLQVHYHLILPPNGTQDRFLGHVWFVQMGPTIELLPNAP